jgi:hypothetical protein
MGTNILRLILSDATPAEIIASAQGVSWTHPWDRHLLPARVRNSDSHHDDVGRKDRY